MDIFEPQTAESADHMQQLKNAAKCSSKADYYPAEEFGCIGRISQAQFLLDSRFRRENVTLRQRMSVLQAKLELVEYQREALFAALNKEKMKACNAKAVCRSAEAYTEDVLFFEQSTQTEAGNGAQALEDLACALEGKYYRVCEDAVAQIHRQGLAIATLTQENEDLQRKYSREKRLRHQLCDGGYVVSCTCVDFELSEEVTSSISYYEEDD